MIVRQFLRWLRTAAATERAKATSALARAYLQSDLTPQDRADAEGALLVLLDDPSPLVRLALAKALAASELAPPEVILGLAADQPAIAAFVLRHSPLLVDADLVDAVATGKPQAQAAIAQRAFLPPAVSAAIAEVGSAEACLVLVENPQAEIAQFSLDRIVARYGHLAAVREAMLAREDLPASTHQALVAKLSETLAGFVVGRAWLADDHAQRVAKEACERATVTLAAASPDSEIRPLIRHLCKSGQLTAGLILRALLSGNVEMFMQALAELSGLSLARVSGFVHDKGGAGFRALFDKAGLPVSTFPAFRAAIQAMHQDGFVGDPSGANRLQRRMVERVLTRCADETLADLEPMLTLLRRFATEAAREEARGLCDARVPDDRIALFYEPDRAAA